MANTGTLPFPSSSVNAMADANARAGSAASDASNASDASDSSDSLSPSMPRPAGAGIPATGGGTQNDLLNRVVQGAHQTIDRLAETAAPHVQRLQEGMSSTGDALAQRADHMREVGDEWTENLRTTVRENPLASLATALALGMLISRLTRR